MKHRHVISLLAVLVVGPGPTKVSAQVPAGPEFRVNTYTFSFQDFAAAASDANGNFVVAWNSSSQDGSGAGVFAQRFDASGLRRGAEFRVNDYTTGSQGGAAVVSDATGNFTVAWLSQDQDGSNTGVFARRFASSGAALGPEFRVNTFTTGAQAGPALATDGAGNLIVVWQSAGQDGSGNGIYGQRFDASGAPLGPEFRVNTFTAGGQVRPSVAADAAGNFVVGWESYTGDGSWYNVVAQRFAASGAPLGAEFRVNSYTTFDQIFPQVACGANGNFVVAWQGDYQDGHQEGIFGQRFAPSGAPLGGEFRVNTVTGGAQRYPAIASDASGDFVVVWQSFAQPGDNILGIFAQRFDASGAARGAEFRANSYTTGAQRLPAVASDASGNFVVTWESANQDGNSYGVFAQRFGGLVPDALAVDTSGNNALEPGEAVDVKPSWRNVNGASQTLGGTALAFTGPAASGVAYELHDATASYGTIANGATAECTDCYHVGVTFGGARPSLHWDATLTERITPDAHGQTKMWAVHLGDSFTDVPRANAFYRFVEVLLHKGVTGGCTGDQYCPASAVTREQMAPFVLVAKEGTGYAPAACTTPMFDDVPASSPFCRWIEELARRGVVAGCGGSNYCPASSVTREQMPVFVLRTLDPALDPPACTTPAFGDVPASSPFCRWIEELARRGVVTGCGGGNYCPASPVTRDQMGVFIGVTFGLTLYGP